MIGSFFIELFKIKEQTDHYYLQAAKINEARLSFSPKYRRVIKFYQQIGRALRTTGYSLKDLEAGTARLADQMRKMGDAIRNGITELSKERSN